MQIPISPNQQVVEKATRAIKRDVQLILVQVQLSNLKPIHMLYKNLPSKIPDIARAYREEGDQMPPPIVEFDGFGPECFILDGHHRVAGAKLAGFEAVWVLQVVPRPLKLRQDEY